MMPRIEPKLEGAEQLEAVEKALTNFSPDKNFAPQELGIHEMIDELQHTIDIAKQTIDLVDNQLKNIKRRMEYFNRLQSDFYNGKK